MKELILLFTVGVLGILTVEIAKVYYAYYYIKNIEFSSIKWEYKLDVKQEYVNFVASKYTGSVFYNGDIQVNGIYLNYDIARYIPKINKLRLQYINYVNYNYYHLNK